MSIKFMRFRIFYFLLSALALAISLFSILRFGFRYSIDFTGGTIWEFSLSTSDAAQKIEEILNNESLPLSSLDQGLDQSFLLKTNPLTTTQREKTVTAFKELDPAWKELRFETLGPSLGAELLKKAIVAVFLSITAILFFVASRFGGSIYGISAILAMLHDSLILFGAFSLFGHFFKAELDTLFLTAVLTTLSFSVHDTIVVYDRIRELGQKSRSLEALCDKAVTETLTRSLNNSMTIIFMLLALVLLGAPATRWFALALLVGTVSGTYSSTFTAVPLVLALNSLKKSPKN